MAASDKSDYRFGGHQTFALRIAWLPKAASALAMGLDPLSDPIVGVVKLGLGKNMVEALRCWVEAYGVAAKSGGVWKLTDFGDAIFGPYGHDRFLEDNQTLWLLHWNVATLQEGAFFAWELLINRWNEPTFTASSVVGSFAAEADRAGRSLSAVTARQHFDVWLHTYLPTRSSKGEETLDSPLSALRFVYLAGSRESSNGRVEPVYAFDLEDKPEISQALFEYCLHQWWEREFEHEETLPLSEVTFGHGSPGRVFRMSETEVRDRLARLTTVADGSFELIESLNQLVLRRRQKANSNRLLKAVYSAEPVFEELEHA